MNRKFFVRASAVFGILVTAWLSPLTGQEAVDSEAAAELARLAVFTEALEAVKEGRIEEGKTRLQELVEAEERSGDWPRQYAKVLFDALLVLQYEGNFSGIEPLVSEAIPLLSEERALSEVDLTIEESGSRAHDFYMLGLIHELITRDRAAAMSAYQEALKLAADFDAARERLLMLEVLEAQLRRSEPGSRASSGQ